MRASEGTKGSAPASGVDCSVRAATGGAGRWGCAGLSKSVAARRAGASGWEGRSVLTMGAASAEVERCPVGDAAGMRAWWEQPAIHTTMPDMCAHLEVTEVSLCSHWLHQQQGRAQSLCVVGCTCAVAAANHDAVSSPARGRLLHLPLPTPPPAAATERRSLLR
jgi:hypothetical protein